MEVIVLDVFEQRLVILFTKGLVEPLRGWVKDFRPNTLQEAIMKTQDTIGTTPKKTPEKTFIPQKSQVMKPPQNPWIGNDNIDEETWKELRRKKILYSCKEPWEPSHSFMRNGKVDCIEVLSSEEDVNEDEIAHI